MTRPLRIEFAGAVYHLTSRGNARQRIFLNNDDRQMFLEILFHVVIRYGWLCYAYCLMDKHYHLLIQIGAPYRDYGYRMKDIADQLGVRYATLSRRLKRIEAGRMGV